MMMENCWLFASANTSVFLLDMICLVGLVSNYLVAEGSSAHCLIALAVELLKNSPEMQPQQQ